MHAMCVECVRLLHRVVFGTDAMSSGARSQINMVCTRFSCRTGGDALPRQDARQAAGYDKAERTKEQDEKQDHHKKQKKQKMVKALLNCWT